MKLRDEVICLKGWFFVVFDGRVLRPSWMSKGPADACLSLLKQGKGTVTPAGDVKWRLQ
jgi:hypothetical protein